MTTKWRAFVTNLVRSAERVVGIVVEIILVVILMEAAIAIFAVGMNGLPHYNDCRK